MSMNTMSKPRPMDIASKAETGPSGTVAKNKGRPADVATKGKSGLAGLLGLLGPHQRKMVLSGVFSVIGEGFGIVPFILVYYLITHMITAMAGKPQGDVHRDFVWLLIFSGIGAVVFKYAFLGLSTYLAHKAAYETLYDLRMAICKKLTKLPLGYFNQRTTGQMKKVILEDVEQMEIFIGHNIPDFIGALVYVTIITLVLFVVDWRLALATIAVLPIGIMAQTITMGKDKDIRRKFFTANENMNATMIQYIQGMPIIKAFNHTVASFNKFAGSVQACAVYENKLVRKWFLPMTIFSVAITANLLFLLPIGAILFLSGIISLSKFVLFLLIGLGLGSPLSQLIVFGKLMDKNLESRARIDAILNAETLAEPEAGKTPEYEVVSAENVVFAYEDKDVLKGVAFDVLPGQCIALVGPSGAGKTTMARLIPRFWDVGAGTIRLGDTDIRDIKLDDLMDTIGFVFQNIFLFNDSIYENIRMGKPEATPAEIEAAAKAARCHDFIMALPDGYLMVVGEKGAKISGGEKQRISIARALLKDAPIIVLDEATAFVDPENEVLVQEAINALAENKTLIVIAHRLSTITAADQILVMDQGRIVAQGTHDALLNESRLYRQMWDAHVAGLGWEF